MEEQKVLELDLHGKKLKALRNLDKLQYLRSLDASCNDLTKIEGLVENKALRELKLYGNQIGPLSGLENLGELCTLLLQFNRISSLGKGLAGCHRLHTLRLDHNLLESVSAGELMGCSASLTRLDLSCNRLHTVKGLGSLGNLADLNLDSNRLEDIQFLACCTKMVHLNLSENPIKIDQLSQLKMPELETLRLGSISLPSLSHLPKLPKLQDLHAPHNSLCSVEKALTLFPTLELLNIKENQLETIQHLECLGELVELVELRVEGNPLCCPNYRAQVTKALPKLEVLDGVPLKVKLSMDSTLVPLMRPMTPSTIGPSLKQVETQLHDAEVHLDQFISSINRKFDLLKGSARPEKLTDGRAGAKLSRTQSAAAGTNVRRAESAKAGGAGVSRTESDNSREGRGGLSNFSKVESARVGAGARGTSVTKNTGWVETGKWTLVDGKASRTQSARIDGSRSESGRSTAHRTESDPCASRRESARIDGSRTESGGSTAHRTESDPCASRRESARIDGSRTESGGSTAHRTESDPCASRRESARIDGSRTESGGSMTHRTESDLCASRRIDGGRTGSMAHRMEGDPCGSRRESARIDGGRTGSTAHRMESDPCASRRESARINGSRTESNESTAHRTESDPCASRRENTRWDRDYRTGSGPGRADVSRTEVTVKGSKGYAMGSVSGTKSGRHGDGGKGIAEVGRESGGHKDSTKVTAEVSRGKSGRHGGNGEGIAEVSRGKSGRHRDNAEEIAEVSRMKSGGYEHSPKVLADVSRRKSRDSAKPIAEARKMESGGHRDNAKGIAEVSTMKSGGYGENLAEVSGTKSGVHSSSAVPIAEVSKTERRGYADVNATNKQGRTRTESDRHIRASTKVNGPRTTENNVGTQSSGRGRVSFSSSSYDNSKSEAWSTVGSSGHQKGTVVDPSSDGSNRRLNSHISERPTNKGGSRVRLQEALTYASGGH